MTPTPNSKVYYPLIVVSSGRTLNWLNLRRKRFFANIGLKWRVLSNYLLYWFRGETKISETNIERPTFSTNIFDEREEREAKLQEEWFCLCAAIAIFCFGVAVSYYIIHNF